MKDLKILDRSFHPVIEKIKIRAEAAPTFGQTPKTRRILALALNEAGIYRTPALTDEFQLGHLMNDDCAYRTIAWWYKADIRTLLNQIDYLEKQLNDRCDQIEALQQKLDEREVGIPDEDEPKLGLTNSDDDEFIF